MTDFPSLTRMPGSDSAMAADDFDPGEIAGMRTAGAILLATAAITLAAASQGIVGSFSAGIVVDSVLGVQLLRLRHSWRAWTLLRAGLGAVMSVLLVLGGLASGSIGAAVVGLGQVGYCASLVLLLWGIPTTGRVLIGRVTFGVSVVFLIAGGLLLPLQERL